MFSYQVGDTVFCYFLKVGDPDCCIPRSFYLATASHCIEIVGVGRSAASVRKFVSPCNLTLFKRTSASSS